PSLAGEVGKRVHAHLPEPRRLLHSVSGPALGRAGAAQRQRFGVRLPLRDSLQSDSGRAAGIVRGVPADSDGEAARGAESGGGVVARISPGSRESPRAYAASMRFT